MNENRFKQLLKDAGLNQITLAKSLGVNRSTISVWKSDNNYPVWLEDYLIGQIAKNKIIDLKSFINEI